MRLAPFILPILFCGPAVAEQSAAPAGQRALEIMLSRELVAHQNDLGAAVSLQDQVTALTKQIDALKAKSAEPAKPDEPVKP